eukprot:362547-Chlamydomonas_euryale.AAC.5
MQERMRIEGVCRRGRRRRVAAAAAGLAAAQVAAAATAAGGGGIRMGIAIGVARILKKGRKASSRENGSVGRPAKLQGAARAHAATAAATAADERAAA